jgi:hypothetical protein
MDSKIKVYIKVNEFNEIVDILSSVFLKNNTGWIMIDEGYGDKYAHAQSQYLDNSLTDMEGSYIYKFINGNIIQK